MKRLPYQAAVVLAGLSFSLSSHAAEGTDWSYDGQAGPARWSELSAEFSTCGAGKNQSPVDLAETVQGQLPELQVDYAAAGDEILHQGHTVEIRYPPGNTLTVAGQTFTLQQLHFHAPSEHTIDGRHYPLEAHLVHANDDGELAVVTVLFEQGEAQAELAEAWERMPHQAGESRALPDGLSAAALLPESRDYYRLSGSLTTPPCSEGVRWLIFKEPIEVSAEQLQAFEEVIGHANNRPLQPLDARIVVE